MPEPTGDPNEDYLRQRVGRLGPDAWLGGPTGDFERIGRLQLDVLVREGLEPTSTVLDVGCGALRAGYWLMHYLDTGRYYGIEPNAETLERGIEGIVEGGLVERAQPTFSTVDDFNLAVFDVPFDFVLARSVWTHASKHQIILMLDGFAEVATASGVLLASYLPAGTASALVRRMPTNVERALVAASPRVWAPDVARRLPALGATRGDYLGHAWVGKSHHSDVAGMVRHRFGWVADRCAERGLTVRELSYGVANHQRWLRVERQRTPRRIRLHT
jgi:SAM-dependent methyltransferase